MLFWYPQIGLLIFSVSGSLWKKSRNSRTQSDTNFRDVALLWSSSVLIQWVEMCNSTCYMSCIGSVLWQPFPRSTEADSGICYFLLQAEPAYRVLLRCFQPVKRYGGQHLRRTQYASTVFRYPQSNIVFIILEINSEKSHVIQKSSGQKRRTSKYDEPLCPNFMALGFPWDSARLSLKQIL